MVEVVADLKPGLPHPQTSRTRRRNANRSCREEKTQWPGAGCLHELGIGMRFKRYTHHICLGFASQHGEALALFGHFLFLLHLLVDLCLRYLGFLDPRLPATMGACHYVRTHKPYHHLHSRCDLWHCSHVPESISQGPAMRICLLEEVD